jgi:hypothetical protein
VTVTPSSASTTVQAPVVAVSAHTLADQNHGTLDPGDTVGVSITVGNTGTGAATSATVDVTLANLFAPAGIEVDGAACGGCSSTSSTVTAPVGALAATTGSHVVTFTATVASAAPGSTVSTSATVTFVPATTGTSPTAASVASSTIGTISDTAPVALADAYTTDEDVPLTVDSAAGVLANDSDAELDVLHATLVSTAAAHGVVNLADDGSFDYTPAANFNGDATFTYSVSDGTLTGNTVTATITVTPVEDPPVLVDGGTATVTSGGQVHIYLTDFASDPDGDPLTFTITTPPAHGTMPCTPGGDCLYTPDSGFSGTDSFQFTASDGVEAAVAPAVTAGPVTVTITVTAEDTTSSSSSSTTSTTSGSGSGGSGSGAGGGGLARTGTNSLLPATALGGTLIAAGLLALGSERRANRRRSRWTHLRRRA